MGQNQSFADILQTKLGSIPPEREPSPTQWAQETLLWYTVLPGHYCHKWSPHQGSKHSYPKAASRPKTRLKQPGTVAQAENVLPSFACDQISKTGQESLHRLIKMGANICDKGFSQAQLKKEYRRLLKVYHPDHSRDPMSRDQLNQLILSYRQLQQELDQAKAQTAGASTSTTPS
jgi:hypothetical protein